MLRKLFLGGNFSLRPVIREGFHKIVAHYIEEKVKGLKGLKGFKVKCCPLYRRKSQRVKGFKGI